MNRDKITELLKRYRAYKYAVQSYETNYLPAPSVAQYSHLPRGGGFGSRIPATNDGLTIDDYLDYQVYKKAVVAIEGAVREVLSDNERIVIESKWMNRNRVNLCDIAIRKDVDESTVRRWHKEALKKLNDALAFVDVPNIEITKKALPV